MRTACLIALLPGILGCSAATNAPAPQPPTRAALLLDEPAQEEILDQARTQTCRASQTKNPQLAAQAKALLDAYVLLHEEHGVDPSWRLEWKIAQAHRDADATLRGVATPYFLGCEPFRVPNKNHLQRERRRRVLQEASRRQSMQATGVIGNPRP